MGTHGKDGYKGPDSNSIASTHLYCKPVKVQNSVKAFNRDETGDSTGRNKSMSSKTKVHSSLVAIDVNVQPFSRMTSFRWSFINVNFMIGRKRKKDKRRNTVAESDVRELKDDVKDKNLFTMPDSICPYQQIMAGSKSSYNIQEYENLINDNIFAERRNNSTNMKSMPNCRRTAENGGTDDEKDSNNFSYIEEHNDMKLNEIEIAAERSLSKRKPQTHIPISTISAAMNVAVEMRQRNSFRTETPVLHGTDHINSSDEKKSKTIKNVNYSSSIPDCSDEENWKSNQKRLEVQWRCNRSQELSSPSSESIENRTSITASTKPDAFFISSDESDDDSIKKKYDSLSSLDRASLNSLLSETEMFSSTETLSSAERSPPSMDLSSTLKDSGNVSCAKYVETDIPREEKGVQISPKQAKQTKSPNNSKSDIFGLRRNLTENSNNIFNSVIGLKSKKKEIRNKPADIKKSKLNKSLPFDMYGCRSPSNVKKMPAHLRENGLQNEGKSHMKSFFVHSNPSQLSKNEISNNLKPPDRNGPCKMNSKSSNDVETNTIQTMNSIQQKYEHQVTVTPIQRCIEDHQMSTEKENRQYVGYHDKSMQNYENIVNQTYASIIGRARPPVTLLKERTNAARVVLDFNGKVIYSSNSLDRKNYNTRSGNMYNSAQVSPCDTHFKNMTLNKDFNYNFCRENDPEQHFHSTRNKSNVVYSQNNSMLYSSLKVPFNYNIKQNMSEEEYCIRQEHCQSTFIDKSENVQTLAYQSLATRPHCNAENSSNAYSHSSLLPDSNISLQENTLYGGKQAGKIDSSIPNDSHNRLLNTLHTTQSNMADKSPQNTISTEDLFEVIHKCKKRMNIKTDSDIPLSRSNSPSYLRPNFPKSTLAETGFLTPRSQVQFEASRDRKSWPDFRLVKSIYGERKLLASDRLGPTKPTSMHDFKMLLLQTRTSRPFSEPRKSAVERLKSPPSNNNSNSVQSLPLDLCTRNSPTTELKSSFRGNKVRASLQPRYIIYPPIFEDCFEDCDNCSDCISDKSTATMDVNDPRLKHSM